MEKVYDPKNEEDDMVEMEEERLRMREREASVEGRAQSSCEHMGAHAGAGACARMAGGRQAGLGESGVTTPEGRSGSRSPRQLGTQSTLF